jgi:hypothetical protein
LRFETRRNHSWLVGDPESGVIGTSAGFQGEAKRARVAENVPIIDLTPDLS